MSSYRSLYIVLFAILTYCLDSFAQTYNEKVGDFTFICYSGTNKAGLKSLEATGDITVPASFERTSKPANGTYNVAYIEPEAISGKTDISSVTVEQSAVDFSVKATAFLNSTSIQWIDLPANTSGISASAFNGCSNLQYIFIRSINAAPAVTQGTTEDLPTGITLYVVDDIMEQYTNPQHEYDKAFWDLFNIKALSEFDNSPQPSSSGVQLHFAEAVFEFPHMESGHKIVYDLPEQYKVSEPNDASYTVDEKTITINEPTNLIINITKDSGTSEIVSIPRDEITPFVSIDNDIIVVRNLDNDDNVSICDNEGKLLYYGTDRTFNLPPGIYIISTPFSSHKIRLNPKR